MHVERTSSTSVRPASLDHWILRSALRTDRVRTTHGRAGRLRVGQVRRQQARRERGAAVPSRQVCRSPSRSRAPDLERVRCQASCEGAPSCMRQPAQDLSLLARGRLCHPRIRVGRVSRSSAAIRRRSRCPVLAARSSATTTASTPAPEHSDLRTGVDLVEAWRSGALPVCPRTRSWTGVRHVRNSDCGGDIPEMRRSRQAVRVLLDGWVLTSIFRGEQHPPGLSRRFSLDPSVAAFCAVAVKHGDVRMMVRRVVVGVAADGKPVAVMQLRLGGSFDAVRHDYASAVLIVNSPRRYVALLLICHGGAG